MRFSRYDPTYDSYSQWNQISEEGTWHIVPPSTLSGLIPGDLLNKANSVMVMASASPQGSVFVANINRVDRPASAIDQEPYIAVFNHSMSSTSGGFVHHGNWDGRTDKPEPDFFTAISASGIDTYYPLKEMPTSGSGLLKELDVDSQNKAFWSSLSALMDKYK